jgi:hypothetical protein
MQTQTDQPLNVCRNLIDLGESGTDIMHGELKWLMLEAEHELALAQERRRPRQKKQWTVWSGSTGKASVTH